MFSMPLDFTSHVNPHTFHVELSAMYRAVSGLAGLSGKSTEDPDCCAIVQPAQDRYLNSLKSSVASYVEAMSGKPEELGGWMEALIHIGPGQQHALVESMAYDPNPVEVLKFALYQLDTTLKFERASAVRVVAFEHLIGQGASHAFKTIDAEEACLELKDKLLVVLARIVEPALPKNGDILPVWEILALENLDIALGSTPHYRYQLIGSIMVEKLCRLHRLDKILRGLRKADVIDMETRDAFARRFSVDFSVPNWIQRFMAPVISRDPEVARSIIEGGMMRLICVERTMDRYEHDLENTDCAAQDNREVVY